MSRNTDFPSRSFDSWKTRSDMDQYPDDEEMDAVCLPCQAGEHERCWHHPAYRRCECFIVTHGSN